MRSVSALIVVLTLCLASSSALAAGFRLPEAGAKAMGMGFAFTAVADDPSAIYFNPAGLTQLEGTNVMAGVTYIKENGAKFTGKTPLSNILTEGATINETQKTLEFFVPNAYITRKASPKFAYGIGVFSPFGLAQEYNGGSYFQDQVTKIELKTIVVNPTVAWKVNDVLSIGGGIDYMWGSIVFEKTPGVPGAATFHAKLDGTGDAWGYNFGILLTPAKSLKIGFNYRSQFELTIKDADFTIGDNTAPLSAFNLGALPSFGFPNAAPFGSKASGVGHIPATAALGISYKPVDKLTLAVDFDCTFWSSFSEFSFTNSSDRRLSTSIQEKWKDVIAVRVGGEYKVTEPLAVRLGFVYDPTPVPSETMSPLLPDSDRFFYTGGVGYTLGNWVVDASYAYLSKKDRTVSNSHFDGTWKGDAHLVALDLGYKF